MNLFKRIALVFGAVLLIWIGYMVFPYIKTTLVEAVLFAVVVAIAGTLICLARGSYRKRGI